jgi:predicted ATPase/class 3 adenylate cyclase
VDIAAWLRKLGLDEYERAFLDNAIDADVLPTLTADDLKDIGVTAVGHRRKLLNALAALREPETLKGGEPVFPLALSAERRAEAERRQLTVLFCDLVGSTALSARLDPEDMSAVMRAYQESCTEVIERWGGHVAKYMGDGVLAYFGWPQAHEDDAERSVRAGLDLAQEVGQLITTDGGSLGARVGVATGLVMVGDLVGEGAAQEQRVIGETPNLAARLQGLAEPGAVVIAEGTRRLIGGLFEYIDLGRSELKGFAAPVRAWGVMGESRAESRFEALHGEQLAVLVGREHEIGLLAERWERAKEGEGQVVLLSGEPGIGKSRIVRALRERLAGEPHMPLSHYCSPHHTNSALYPVIGLLERAAGFTRDDRADARLEKLEALLARGTEALGEAVPLIAALLGIATDERYREPVLSPQRRKQRTLEVLVDQVEGLAARQPVLAVYEDVHWVDPTTLEALDLLIERVQRLPVLVLITFRPEFSPPWTGHAHVMQLSLSRLTRRHGQALVTAVTGGKTLPDEVLDQILAKTDGVPLFVEELTKTVLESGLLTDAGDRYQLAGPLPPLAIPATLHDSLMARLDRLAQVKEVAQIGAVMGREFAHELVAAVAPLPEDQLSHALDQLVASELVFRRGTPPQATYTFKHALVQDAAYQSLLKSRRQQLHAQIAQVLEEQLPETADSQPEILAHHCAEAGLCEKAVGYWHKAGQLAIARSAMAEAVAQLSKGLEMLQRLAEGFGRDRQELGLQLALGVALISLRGQPAPETGEAYSRARELCRRLGETEQLFPVLHGQWAFHVMRAAHTAAIAVAKEFLQVAQQQNDCGPLLIGHRIAGTTAMYVGRPNPARAHLEQTLALYDPERHCSLAFLYALDPRATAKSWLSWVLLALGYPGQALARYQEALAEARRLAHPFTLAQVLFSACVIQQILGDRKAVEGLAQASFLLANEQGFPLWLATATIFQGWALARAGEADRAITQMQRGLAAYRAMSAELWVPYFLGMLAEAHGNEARAAEALCLLDKALAKMEQTDERWWEAELRRLQGDMLLRLPDPDRTGANACFQRAIGVARKQDAKLWELRAASSLARLWAEQGKRAEARNLLAPIYGWFTEGFGTRDLMDAKGLLDELQ